MAAHLARARTMTHPSGVNQSLLWPAAPSPRVAGFFNWWTGRMFRSSFNAIRAAPGTRECLARLDALRGPAVVVMNHQSWWDPLTGLRLAALLTPARPVYGPMQLDQLRKFAILRRLGVFGLDPDRPGALDELVRYARWLFQTSPHACLWITPQGQFADPRLPVRIRPGVATVAARLGPVTDAVVSIAVEMPFWTDQRPEILVRATALPEPVEPPASTLAWTRAITGLMQDNAAALAALGTTRDAAVFECLTPDRGGRINPLYDLWLRLRGRSGRLDARDRGMAAARSQPAQGQEAPQ